MSPAQPGPDPATEPTANAGRERPASRTTRRRPRVRRGSGQRPEDAYLGVLPSLGYGLQHVLTMYGGVVDAHGEEVAVVEDHLVAEARERVATGELTDTAQIRRVYKTHG